MIGWRLYAALGGLLVLSALVGTILYYRGEARDARWSAKWATEQMNTALVANASQARYIEQIALLRADTDKAISALADKIDAIHKEAAEQTQAIRDLEQTNETVRAYLSGAVPSELIRVLDGAGAGRN